MSESSDEEIWNPMEVKVEVSNSELNLLPSKSEDKYWKVYESFDIWWHENRQKTYSEAVILSYFYYLAETRQPNTLWSIYSMLKATFKIKHGVDIGGYPKLMSFLKKNSEGFKAKTSKILTAGNIMEFLQKAPDSIFLATKVALIVGISGACHASELLNITVNSFEKHSDKLVLVNLLNSKNKIDRSFVIREEYVDVIEKYKKLRPLNMESDRFFFQYRSGKCSRKPIGRHKFGGMPREIATYLQLDNPELYTGHCFRKTSAALLAHSGSSLNLATVKCHSGWKSSTMVEKSNKDSTQNTDKISLQLQSVNVELQTSPTLSEKDCPQLPFPPIEIKVEEDTVNESQVPTTKKTCSQPATLRESDHLLSPTTTTHSKIKVETDKITHSQISTTKITVPKKNITFNIQNCTNFSFHFY